MKFLYILFLVAGFTGTGFGQRPADSTFFQPRPGIPAHLKPIERTIGPVYYYGGKRLRSPYSLEIPFNELDDPEVNRKFRAYRTLVTAGQLVTLVPLAYILTRPKGGYVRPRGYWAVYVGSIVATLGFTIIGNTKVRQAVTRYNKVLADARFGFSVEPLPGSGHAALGVGLTARPRW
ncbi:hypothetical protein [Larkinella soli]|uniref:hypothetical protein n=1 Tax=Larkinella soli TaxID=1770527 RepID=UPI000FFCABB0|nr:hypothetical protein [Larkinella soli]